MFPKFNKRQFANIVTGDETWFRFFDIVRILETKYGLLNTIQNLKLDYGGNSIKVFNKNVPVI